MKVVLKLWKFMKEVFSDFGNVFFVFTVRYKSINAYCVTVNAKAIQPYVRNKRYRVYKVNGKKKCPKSTGESVGSERKKYTCFELIMSITSGWCFHGILSIHMSVPVPVCHKIMSALYLETIFKGIIMTIQTQSIIRWHANWTTHILSLYISGVTPFQRCD